MNGNVLLDTSVIIDHFCNTRLNDQLDGYAVLYVPTIVLGELYYGAFKSDRPQVHLDKINEFRKSAIMRRVDEQTAEQFGRVRAELHKMGKPIPEHDIWVAALTLQYQLPVVARDKHFKCVPNLIVRDI